MPGLVVIRGHSFLLAVVLPALFVLGNCGRRRDTWLAEYRTGRKCEPYDTEAANSVLYPAKIEPPGVHDARVAKYFERFDGCACRPEYWTEGVMSARSRECGPFPCTPSGCYVQACEADGDCTFGLCSSHASAPNGWCVKDDPH